MAIQREDIRKGTLELLVLRTLARGEPMHGFEVADFIQEISTGVLQVEEGSLYPALQRLLLKGWITGEWGRTEENRKARYYRLTAEGRKQLSRELDRYARVSQAIASILQPV
jgi:PadR family transcriptional regulator, regulatory protein PadR